MTLKIIKKQCDPHINECYVKNKKNCTRDPYHPRPLFSPFLINLCLLVIYDALRFCGTNGIDERQGVSMGGGGELLVAHGATGHRCGGGVDKCVIIDARGECWQRGSISCGHVPHSHFFPPRPCRSCRWTTMAWGSISSLPLAGWPDPSRVLNRLMSFSPRASGAD